MADVCLGKIQPWAVVPEWQTTGEIDWLRRDKAIVNAATGEYTYTTSAASNFLASDGRIMVTVEMAKRLLEHGECSLDCVRMPIIDCSNEPQEASDSWLQGTRDGRLITIDHIRVSRAELEAYISSPPEPRTERLIAHMHKLPGVSKAEILNAPWQFAPGFGHEQLAGLLDGRPKWIQSAILGRGKRGGTSYMWNPATLAMLLHDKKGLLMKGLTRVINDKFESYLDEWNKYRLSCTY